MGSQGPNAINSIVIRGLHDFPPSRIRNGGRQIKRMIAALGAPVQTEKECIESLFKKTLGLSELLYNLNRNVLPRYYKSLGLLEL